MTTDMPSATAGWPARAGCQGARLDAQCRAVLPAGMPAATAGWPARADGRGAPGGGAPRSGGPGVAPRASTADRFA